MIEFVIALIVISIVSVGIYLLVVYREVPGAVETRLGKLEDLPENLGEWSVDTESDEGRRAAEQGLEREVRYLQREGGVFDKPALRKQVRYRSKATRKIERVDPEEVVPRRRVKATS